MEASANELECSGDEQSRPIFMKHKIAHVGGAHAARGAIVSVSSDGNKFIIE